MVWLLQLTIRHLDLHMVTEHPLQDFVVTSLVLKYKLVAGRYQRDHNRLEVQQTNRYLMNLYYDGLLERS